MGRAEDLFQRLELRGLSELRRLIDDREAESLFLDFKRSPRDGSDARLSDEDSKNLSKAISGFANSEGGLLIWGVDCRRNSTGVEVPNSHPLLDACGFRTKVEEAISRSSIPPHSSVRALSILEADGMTGYLAVLIPKSDEGPVRSTSTRHYHLRTGSSFEIVPHDSLAGMFGRSPRPMLLPRALMRFARMDDRKEKFVVAVGLVFINCGAVIAERPYVSLGLNDLRAEYLRAAVPNGMPYALRRGNLPSVSVIGNPGVSLPPGASDDVCDLVFSLPRGHRSDISIKCTVGCVGAVPRVSVLRATGNSFEGLIDRAMRNVGMSASDVFAFEAE